EFCGEIAHDVLVHVIAAVAPADEDSDERAREISNLGREAGRGLLQYFRRDAAERSDTDKDVRSAQAVVFGDNHKIEARGITVRRLNVDRECVRAVCLFYCKAHRYGLPAAGNQNIRPGRGQQVALRAETFPRLRTEPRRQQAPRARGRYSFDGKIKAERLRRADTLVFHPGAAVGDDPAGRPVLSIFVMHTCWHRMPFLRRSSDLTGRRYFYCGFGMLCTSISLARGNLCNNIAR